MLPCCRINPINHFLADLFFPHILTRLPNLTGCDKTVPAQLMGAISANKPPIHLVTGPMMPGSHRGSRVGACTDCRGYWAAYRAGSIDLEDIAGVNDELAPTVSLFPSIITYKYLRIDRCCLGRTDVGEGGVWKMGARNKGESVG